MSEFKTADLCDEHDGKLHVCEPMLTGFGGKRAFHGPVSTVKCFEDNSLVREALSKPGNGGVLVVDAGGSKRCAMLGDLLAKMGVDNGWSGVVLYGCIRDSAEIAQMPLGVMALGTHPRKSVKKGVGEVDVTVHFAGVSFHPGQYLYADEDGVLVSPEPL